MEAQTLNTLAQRVRAKFGGRYPKGTSASDCLQDAIVLLLELERQKDRVPPGVNPEAWLVTRAHGDLRDRYARQWKASGKVNVVAEVDGGITDDYRAPDQDLLLDVRNAVDHLEGLQKQCMLLTLQGKTQEQIAAIIGHTQPSVSQIMTRAKQRLKELLPGYEEEE